MRKIYVLPQAEAFFDEGRKGFFGSYHAPWLLTIS